MFSRRKVQSARPSIGCLSHLAESCSHMKSAAMEMKMAMSDEPKDHHWSEVNISAQHQDRLDSHQGLDAARHCSSNPKLTRSFHV